MIKIKDTKGRTLWSGRIDVCWRKMLLVLYHLEAISRQSTGSHTCLALTNVSE
jgi:hypothetical protein